MLYNIEIEIESNTCGKQCRFLHEINSKEYPAQFKNIPVGYTIKLLAFRVENNKIYAQKQKLTVQQNQIVSINLKELTSNEFRTYLKKHNK